MKLAPGKLLSKINTIFDLKNKTKLMFFYNFFKCSKKNEMHIFFRPKGNLRSQLDTNFFFF